MFFLKTLPTRRMVEGYADRMGDADPDRILAALEAMREASLLIRRLDAYFAEHGLSQLRYLALVVIDREPEAESLTHREIADRLDVSKPVVTRTLRTLTEDGQIAPVAKTGDARERRYRLTHAGRATLAAIMPGYFAILSETGPT